MASKKYFTEEEKLEGKRERERRNRAKNIERYRERERISSKKYRKVNNEKSKEVVKSYRKRHPYRIKARYIKDREILLGILSVITEQDLIDIHEKFNHKCFNCGSTKRLVFDHFYPVQYKIPLNKENCVLLCDRCNCGGRDMRGKHDKHPKEFFTKEQIKDLKDNYGIKIRRKL